MIIMKNYVPEFNKMIGLVLSGSGPPERNSLESIRSLKFPTGIPWNAEDSPKLSLFLDSDSFILRKICFFELLFGEQH